MQEKVKRLCDIFVENKNVIRKNFQWEHEYMSFAAAAQLACKGRRADVETLKNCQKILKNNTGIFSEMRSYVKLPLLVNMTAKDDPESYLQEVKRVNGNLKKQTFDYGYRILAAMNICENVADIYHDERTQTTNEIYSEMKKKHSFLTDEQDMPAASLLALSNKSTMALTEDMEACFALLKKRFHRSNANQAISEVLALCDGTPQVKAQRAIDIYDTLKKNKCSLESGSIQLAILGCLASLNLSVETICNEVKETELYLKQFKGFGSMSLGSYLRRMYAAMLVVAAYTDDADASVSTAISSSVTTSIATEIAILCCIIACTSSSAAATAAATY